MPDRERYHASAQFFEEALSVWDEVVALTPGSATAGGSPFPPYICLLGSAERSYQVVITSPRSYERAITLPTSRYTRRCFWKWCLCFSSLLLAIVAGAATIAWFGILQPDLPDFEVEKIKINSFHVHAKHSEMLIPKVLLDVNLTLSVLVVNPNAEGFMYDEMVIRVAYGGQDVGKVTSPPGRVPPHSSRLVVGIADLQGVDVGRLGPMLIGDWRKGRLPAVIETVFRGRISVLAIETHVQANVRCDVLVNPRNRTLLGEECDVDVEGL